MKKRTIRILGIAPYKGLKNTMINLAENRNDIELTVCVGNLQAGVQIAKQQSMECFDVIISRGGTAELLRQESPVPVIEIQLSIYDILCAIKLVDSTNSSYAMVGFPGITSQAHLLCDLLHYEIEIITVHKEEEVPVALENLKKKGLQFVLCDMIAETIARQIGLNPILITSGSESIQAAFDQAIQIFTGFSYLQDRTFLLEQALKSQTADTIILTTDGSVFFSTYQAENVDIILDYLKNLIQKQELRSMPSKSFHFINHSLYAISMQNIFSEYTEFYLFCIESNPVPSESSKHGLRFSDCTEMKDMYFNSFYSLTTGATDLTNQITQINQSSLPVMILGERGSGKNQAAARLYIESQQNNHPYITIDCQLLNKRNWDFLTHHYNSPFCDTDNTIFISNIQSLSSIQRKQLLSLMIDTNLHKRNRILISCSETLEEENLAPAKEFINYLPCITLYMPPLRERLEDIASSSNLYLNMLNIELSKQVVGFEPEALEALCCYNWPDNFMQLKRVLMELVMLTTTPYIQLETVKKILTKEKQQYTPTTLPISSFDYNRPLNDMVRDLIETVITQCDGNQTQAAKKLGIGRTTLWRLRKND